MTLAAVDSKTEEQNVVPMNDILPYYIVDILRDNGIPQTKLCEYLQVSIDTQVDRSTFNKLLNQRRWTKKFTSRRASLDEAIVTFLTGKGVSLTEAKRIWEDGTPIDPSVLKKYSRMHIRQKNAQANLHKQRSQATTIQPEPEMLTANTKSHFKVARDPFVNEINSPEDLFLHEQQRFVREQMLNTVNSGTMLAVIAESGAGKTQVRKAFYHSVSQSDGKMIIIEPQVVDKSSMKPGAILSAIVDELELGNLPNNMERVPRIIQKELRARVVLGYKFALIFEEAHDLPDKVLKYLKRIWEWDDGFRKLLGIILVGQNELRNNLHETQLQVREFSRRCHQVELYPLGDSMGEYLTHKFNRAGQDINKIMTPEAVEHLRKKLLGNQKYGVISQSVVVDHSYPLTVNAWVSSAMNLASKIGEPLITPEVIDMVKESL